MKGFYNAEPGTAYSMDYALQPPIIEEVSLWRMAIIRAIQDCIQEDMNDIQSKKRKREAQIDAINWFCNGNKDFVKVCQYAGLEPDEVQHSILDYLTKPGPIEIRIFKRIMSDGARKAKRSAQRTDMEEL